MTSSAGPGPGGTPPAGSGPAGSGPAGPAKARIRPFLNAPRPAGSPDPGGTAGEVPGEPPGHDAATPTGASQGNAAAGGAAPSGGKPDSVERPRPFVLTAGRVNGVDPAISLETQVSARAVPPPGTPAPETLSPELQTIIAMCAQPVSVAEISARIPLHLGVTKILVGDLRASGYLDVHTMDVANPHDPDTILRVIRGLRAIP